MYLRELLLRNNGPIRDLHMLLGFTSDNRPLPTVIVGRNGSGKTNLLSQISDALMEGAAGVYSDVLTPNGIGRNWFRIVGGRTLTYESTFGYSILRFQHDSATLFYSENSGDLPPENIKAEVPASLADGVNWTNDGDHSKQFSIEKKVVESIYPQGVYAFFPSSRAETPYWLNRDAILTDDYDMTDRFSQRLGKAMFIEHGLDQFTQWMLGVLTETRAPVQLRLDQESGQIKTEVANLSQHINNLIIYSSANSILQLILDDPTAQFYWAGRRQPRKIGVALGNVPIAKGLDSLSGGQSSLLSMFGSILQQADSAGKQPAEVEGIVVIDELDAHMHIDLQSKALPALIEMFPKIQFLISSHSPFFALGMEKVFGAENVRLVELPSGLSLSAEAYSEFDNALNALRETRTFEKEISDRVQAGDAPIILVGGETDLPYFRTAAELLGYPNLVSLFEWIGMQGKTGSGFNTGDNALTAAVNLLKSNPGFVSRKIVIIFDCDANKPDESFENVSVIAIPTKPDRKATKGIENLLPNSALTSQFYPQKTIVGPYGETKSIEEFDKTGLCEYLCGPDAQASNFADFKPILEQIDAILFPGQAAETESETVDPISSVVNGDVAEGSPSPEGDIDAPSQPDTA